MGPSGGRSARGERPIVLSAVLLFLVLAVVAAGAGSLAMASQANRSGSPAPGAIPLARDAPSRSPAALNATKPGQWTEGTDYGAASGDSGTGGIATLGTACVSNDSTVYCVGGNVITTGYDISDVFYASVSASGTVGPWVETTDYGATSGTSGSGGIEIDFTSCVAYGGYIYCFGGALNSTPYITSKSFYAPLSASGVGAWTETTDFAGTTTTNGTGGIATELLACVVSGSDVYCAGGKGSEVYYAPLSASGVGAWVETTDYGATSGSSGTGGVAINTQSCAVNGSYDYCVGGINISDTPQSRVYSAPLSSTGVGAWTETTDYAAASGESGTGGLGIYGEACTSDSGVIICVDGDTNGGNSVDYVYYANVSAGGVGPWINSTVYGDSPLGTYHLACTILHALGILLCTTGFTSDTFTTPLHGAAPPPPPAVTITTQLSSTSVQVGQTFTDQATLHGAGPSTGGTVYFRYYTTCNPYYEIASVQANVSGGEVPPSPGFTAVSTTSGTSAVLAYYYAPNGTVSAAPCEPITVTPYTPTLTTQLSESSIAAGSPFTDSGSLAGAWGTAAGTVDFHLYSDGACENATGAVEGTTVTDGVLHGGVTFTAVASKSGQNSIQAFYGGDLNDSPASSVCETIKVTSSSTTTPPATTSPSSPSTSSTFLGLPRLEGVGVVVGIVALLGVLLGAFLLWRRTDGNPPPPPTQEKPPTPVAPPATTYDEACQLYVGDDGSEKAIQIDLSERADAAYKGKGADLKAALAKKIEEEKVYSSEDWGVAVAVSEGASVGGGVAAGSLLSTLGGSQTDTIRAAEKGWTEIELSITAPDGARTMISASVIVLVEANASVLDVPADLWEGLEIESWITAGTETLLRGAGFKEWLEKFKEAAEAIAEHLPAEEKAQLVQELTIWTKAFANALKDPASAGKNVKILVKNLWRIMRKYGGGKIFKVWELGKFLGIELGAAFIEKVGTALLVNADVVVHAHGTMGFSIQPCSPTESPVAADARRHLWMDQGELKEPTHEEFTRQDIQQSAGACSTASEMTIRVDGTVEVDGSAKYDGDGYANVNSIWAANWVMACEHGSPGAEGYRREQKSGSRWGGWFKVPESARAKFPSDTTLADTADMRNYVQTLLDGKLESLMSETFEGTQNSPLDGSKNTETKLQGVLSEWARYIQESVGLFAPSEEE